MCALYTLVILKVCNSTQKSIYSICTPSNRLCITTSTHRPVMCGVMEWYSSKSGHLEKNPSVNWQIQ